MMGININIMGNIIKKKSIPVVSATLVYDDDYKSSYIPNASAPLFNDNSKNNIINKNNDDEVNKLLEMLKRQTAIVYKDFTIKILEKTWLNSHNYDVTSKFKYYDSKLQKFISNKSFLTLLDAINFVKNFYKSYEKFTNIYDFRIIKKNMNINEYEYRERFRVYFDDTYVNISILNKMKENINIKSIRI